MQQFLYRPASIRQSSHHRRSALAVLPGLLFSFPANRLRQFLFQALMVADKVIICSPPLQVFRQLRRELCRTPGAAGQFRNALPNRSIHAFDKSSVDPAAQSGFLQTLLILLLLALQQTALHLHGSSAALVLDDLPVQKLAQQHPGGLLPLPFLPPAKIGLWEQRWSYDFRWMRGGGKSI
jgi:hypothetical protein